MLKRLAPLSEHLICLFARRPHFAAPQRKTENPILRQQSMRSASERMICAIQQPPEYRAEAA
jgi:hypothetical protein